MYCTSDIVAPHAAITGIEEIYKGSKICNRMLHSGMNGSWVGDFSLWLSAITVTAACSSTITVIAACHARYHCYSRTLNYFINFIVHCYNKINLRKYPATQWKIISYRFIPLLPHVNFR
jgi:hypothetical protein